MKKAFSFALALIMLLVPAAFSAAEEGTGIVAKVTTENKGPRFFRERPEPYDMRMLYGRRL